MKILLCFALAALLLGCTNSPAITQPLSVASDLLECPSLGQSAIAEYDDSHGGFNGDGKIWIKVLLTPKDSQILKTTLASSDRWKRLPEIGNLKKLPLDKRLPLNLSNGYYFFRDLQPEYYPSYESNARPPHDRSSYNFVFGVFDVSENLLYVYNLDT